MASSISSVQPIQPLEVPHHSLDNFLTEGHKHDSKGKAKVSNHLTPDENGEEEAKEDNESRGGVHRKSFLK